MAKAVDKGKSWETNRGVGAHILGDTGGITDLAVELVLVDTVGTGRFADMAGAAGEHELVGGAVLLGIKQVGAKQFVNTRSFGSFCPFGRKLIPSRGSSRLTTRGRIGSESDRPAWCHHQQLERDWQTLFEKSDKFECRKNGYRRS